MVWKTNSLTIIVAMETSNLVATKDKTGMKLQNSHPQRIVAIGSVCQVPEELPLEGLSTLDMTQLNLCPQAMSGVFAENNRQQVFNTEAA